MKSVVVIAHNIRSTHNVGSFFRTCDGFGVTHLYLTGYTPYPELSQDTRLPHIRQKLTAQIHKTALGAETTIPFTYAEQPATIMADLKKAGYRLVALEQAPTSILLSAYKAPEKIALLLGEEVHGITADLLALADDIIEIPMQGQKESFNVGVSLGIALYGLTSSSSLIHPS